MFDSDKPDVYEKVYQEVAGRLAGANIAGAARDLGLTMDQGRARVPLLDRLYLVGPQGVERADGRPAHVNPRIVLVHYLLHGGVGEPALRYVPYRQLPGGQDFARSLSQLVEGPLARAFSGRPDLLAAAAKALGGREEEESAAGSDGAYIFEALPKLPMKMTFYDADSDFPAEVKVFYDLTAPNFLDLECLAALGGILAGRLKAHLPPG